MTSLREWQAEALDRLLRDDKDFLCVATPGAGKTTFALTAAQKLIELGEVRRVIVIAPTAHLRGQWAKAAARMGIQLDHTFANGNGALAKDFDGIVVTYASVAGAPLLWAKLATDLPTLVILDEVHHAGEDEHLSWGPALKQAFGDARRRLLLSGTPFRSDRRPIPFVEYDQTRKCVPTYNYDYGQALRDRGVVRPIAFAAWDGHVRWRDAGAIVATALADTDEETLANALKSALDPKGEWISSVLRRADTELTRLREEVPEAGGLVVASDQSKAYAYADLLQKISGERPTVAVSDEPEASKLIADFAKSDAKWIVAVQMVSEGVDIPRLAVGVYASRYKTEMFFRQVVGRFVRLTGIEDETTATLFIPSVQPLLGFAENIEKTVEAVLAEEKEKIREDREGNTQEVFRFDLVEPLDSSEAIHHSTILNGSSFDDAELKRAQNLAEQVGLPGSVSPAQIAQMLRLAGHGRLVGTATVSKEHIEHRTRAEEKAVLRRAVNRGVARLSRATGTEYAHIHAALNRQCGDIAKTATIETLQRRLELLDRYLEEGHETP